MKCLKRILYTTVCFIAVLFCGLIIFINTLDPSDYKSAIGYSLTKALGHETVIKGKIDWDYFPRLALNIQQIQIRENDKPIAEIGSIEGSVSLIPLLSKKLIIKKAILKDATLKIKVDEKGQNNWFNNDDKKEAIDETAQSKPIKHSSKDLAFFELKKLTIDNANIMITTPKSEFHINQFTFNAQNVSLKHPMTYTLSSLLKGTLNQKPFSTRLLMQGSFFLYPSDDDIGSNGLETTSTLALQSLQYNELKAGDIRAILSANNKRYDVVLKKLNAYKGVATGSLSYDKTTHALAIETNIQKVTIGPLLKALNDVTILDGLLSSHLQITAKGTTQKEIFETLSGSTKINVEDGTLNYIDIYGIVRWVDSLLLNKKSLEQMLKKLSSTSTYTNLFNKKSTPFRFLTGDAVIKNGIATFNDIDLTSKLLRVSGSGKVSLIDLTLDFNLKAGTTEKYDPNDMIKQTFGPGIPFRVHGSLDDPSVNPDMKSITQAVSKRLFHNVSKDLNGSIRSINKGIKKIKKILE